MTQPSKITSPAIPPKKGGINTHTQAGFNRHSPDNTQWEWGRRILIVTYLYSFYQKKKGQYSTVEDLPFLLLLPL